MNNNLQDLETIKSQIRPRLPDYIRSRGINYIEGKNICCINPSHPDKNPSCGLMQGDKGWIFHCFGCGVTGDIFKAAHFLEGLPAEGKGFVYDNVYALAERFGIDFVKPEFTEEEMYEHQVYLAYKEASHIISVSQNETVSDKLIHFYGWSPVTQTSLGIGTVVSYDDYIQRMLKAGFKKEFLRDTDLDNKKLFSPNNLIYTVSDAYGRPVGFAARNLLYQNAWDNYLAAVDFSGEDSVAAKEAKKAVPSKYYNSTEHAGTQLKNPIYKKGSRLFGFHIARKAGSPLYVFEGYADCATAQDRGLDNCCAIGSTSFTDEHFDLLLDYSKSIKHIVFVLDADKAGREGTSRFVEKAEKKFSAQVGIQVEIIEMPEGSDDPDKMIREHGIQEFRDLPRTSLFAWKMSRLLDSGTDYIAIAEKMARLIVNEPMPLLRYKMCTEVAEKLHIPKDVLLDTIKALTNEDKARLEEQRSVIAHKLAIQLKKDPDRIGHILERGMSDLQTLGAEMGGYNPQSVIKVIRQSRKDAHDKHANHRLTTGWMLFDDLFGGFPIKDAFISVPGQPNGGKTAFLANCCWRVLDHNPDAICFYHTMDDALGVFLPRLMGSRMFLPSMYFKETGDHLEYLKNNGLFDKIEEGEAWLDEVVSQQRLVVADTSMLPRDLGAFSLWLKELRAQFPDKPILGFADNFHHYDIRSGGPTEGEGKVSYIARFAKDLSIKYSCTLVMTMELGKKDLAPGIRPRLSTLKGSSSMAYEASANIGVYNDLKSLGQRSNLKWDDHNDTQIVFMSDGIATPKPTIKPIVELVFDKSKIHKGFDGVIYYKLDPSTGRYDEEPPKMQDHWGNIALSSNTEEEANAAQQQNQHASYNSTKSYKKPFHQQPVVVPPLPPKPVVADDVSQTQGSPLTQ